MRVFFFLSSLLILLAIVFAEKSETEQVYCSFDLILIVQPTDMSVNRFLRDAMGQLINSFWYGVYTGSVRFAVVSLLNTSASSLLAPLTNNSISLEIGLQTVLNSSVYGSPDIGRALTIALREFDTHGMPVYNKNHMIVMAATGVTSQPDEAIRVATIAYQKNIPLLIWEENGSNAFLEYALFAQFVDKFYYSYSDLLNRTAVDITYNGCTDYSTSSSGYTTYSTYSGTSDYPTTYSTYSGTSDYTTYSTYSGTSDYTTYSTYSGTSDYPTTYSTTYYPSTNSGTSDYTTYSGTGHSTYSTYSGTSDYTTYSGTSDYTTYSGTGYSTYSTYSGTSDYTTYSTYSGTSDYTTGTISSGNPCSQCYSQICCADGFYPHQFYCCSNSQVCCRGSCCQADYQQCNTTHGICQTTS